MSKMSGSLLHCLSDKKQPDLFTVYVKCNTTAITVSLWNDTFILSGQVFNVLFLLVVDISMSHMFGFLWLYAFTL